MYKVLFLALPFYIFASDNINLENKNLDIKIVEPKEKTVKTKEDYENKDSLTKEVKPFEEETEENKKDDNIEIDGSVDVNKETKSIDKVNINLGTKF